MRIMIFAILCFHFLAPGASDLFSDDLSGKAVRVEKINAEIVDATKERVCIQLSESVAPRIRALEGDKPRVFMDIDNVQNWDLPTRIEVGGRMILRVRSHWDRRSKRSRIVLDLEPSGDYLIEQTFITSGNIFCLDTFQKKDH